MGNQKPWLVVGCLVAVAVGALAVAPAATLADHDPNEPHNETDTLYSDSDTESPIAETWNRTYEIETTVETSGDGRTWNVTYPVTVDDVVETSDGNYVFAGSASQWDDSIDRAHTQALLWTTSPNGDELARDFYGVSAPDSAERRVECLTRDEVDTSNSFLEQQLENYDGPSQPSDSHPLCGVTFKDPRGPEPGENREYQSFADSASTVTETADGGFVFLGQTSNRTSLFDGDSSYWLVKVDSDGTEEWNRTFGGSATSPNDVIQTDDGGYLVVGESYEFSGGADAWLWKLDSSGNEEWNRGYGGPEDDRAFDVIETSDGNYAAVGESYSYTLRGDTSYNNVWLLTVDEDGNELVNETYTGAGRYGDRAFEQANAIVEPSDGGFLIGGRTTAFTDDGTDQDAWLIRTDENGNEQWNRTYGGSDQSEPQEDELVTDIVETHDGGFMFAGEAEADTLTDQQTSTWLVKTDDSGTHQWNETVQVGRLNRPNTLIATSDGEYLVTVSQTGNAAAGIPSASRAIKFSDQMQLDDDTDSSTGNTTPSDAGPDGDNSTDTDDGTPSDAGPDETETPGGDNSTDTDDGTPSTSGPGFGVVAALLAVLGAALLARHRE